MITSFLSLEKRVKRGQPVRICVAGAYDEDLLLAINMLTIRGYISSILVGDREKIKTVVDKLQLEQYTIVEVKEGENAAEKAVALVKEGRADVLMKGTVDTTKFMRAILDKQKGLRTEKLISMVAVYQIAHYHKLVYLTDGGINVAPTYEQKKGILRNSVEFLNALGYKQPKVAVLTASEILNPNVPATVDADLLSKDARNKEFGSCIVEGPIALDVAFSKLAAAKKHINSEISGDVDLVMMPSVEAGNILGKSWSHFGHATWAGIVLGCEKPALITSRSDGTEVKMNSIVLGCLAFQYGHV